MGFKQEGWLPHLVETVPVEARKNHTSMYTIALEGWRRGLKLKFYNLNLDNKLQIRYSLTYKNKTHHFNGSSGDLISEEAFEICEDKGKTNYYLLNAGVPIPKGRQFGIEATETEIIEFANRIKYPVVLKPTKGSAGRGVIAGIINEEQLKSALDFVRNTLGFDDVLVQEYIEGEEVRIYVLGNRVLAASNRRPANIVGDGKSTIQELIKEKNKFRKYVPHLYYRPIRIDSEVNQAIRSYGYTLDSIPKKGKRLYLRKISNVSRGGDPVDVTDFLTEEQKNIAIRATKAIPGLVQCGVDMMINKKTGKGVILELNTRPGIGSHLFPIEGQATDIPKEIIDFYFPETKHISTKNQNVYFGFGSIIEPLRGRSMIAVEVQPNPGRLTAKKYIIQGEFDLLLFYKWIKKHIDARKLHGHVERMNEQQIELVVAGPTSQELNYFTNILNEAKHKFLFEDVVEEEWDNPIQLGFELRGGFEALSLKGLRAELRNLQNQKREIQKETRRIKHRINLIRESRTWKFTAPIRFFNNKIKQ